MKAMIEQEFLDSINLKQKLLPLATETLAEMAEKIVQSFKNSGKLLIFGNGGSAADAQHIAGELVGRFKVERKALPCIALTTDTSIITAVANDYDFGSIFARQVEGLARKGDVILAISTSGNSPNVIRGLTMAREIGCVTLAFGGKDGGQMLKLADLAIIVPSNNSPRIQEGHILLAHTLCLLVEAAFA
ncbi:D-sedoheptulose 7-phosphate isomerase [candidate division CSSED10-310 bacterium]|uniref:Phosphoheptose isomerase n=1 Tax=candidate division CSSED10-310 bacterium TaxID=2855610 RepID=A0ABV6YS05_UNCC1